MGDKSGVEHGKCLDDELLFLHIDGVAGFGLAMIPLVLGLKIRGDDCNSSWSLRYLRALSREHAIVVRELDVQFVEPLVSTTKSLLEEYNP